VNAEQWKSEGQLIEVNGFKHFVVDSDTEKPCLLILHGYPSCTYDFHKTLPFLAAHYRVVMHDHLGFGYSNKPSNYSYSLMEQTDQALMLWCKLGIKEGTVLAHDYGTSIATELLARRERHVYSEFKIKQMVLCNGSMHVELAQLRLIQKLLLNRWSGPWAAKLASRHTLARNLKNIYFDSSQITDTEIDALWQMMTFNQGRKVLHKTTQYIKQRYTYWYRWIGALQSTDLPIHIIWAKDDPVAVVEMATTLQHEITHSRLTLLEKLGHFPMLEAPERWSNAVINSLAKQIQLKNAD